MTLTIGRVDALRPSEVRRYNGDGLTIDGTIDAASDTELDVRRQQLLGLLEPEEDAFPLTWDADPTLDGFYRVADVAVDPFGVEGGKRGRFRLNLSRIGGSYARAQFETILQQLLRPNDHGVTAGNRIGLAYHSPTIYTWNDIDIGSTTFGNSNTINTEDGNEVIRYALSGGSLQTLAYWRAYLKPADYYKATARLEVKYGNTWYPVHGRQLPLAAAGNWRISNGWVRVYPTAVSGNGRFTVEQWKPGGGGSWNGKEYWVGTRDGSGGAWNPAGATGDATGFAVPIILANTPNMVIVRIAVSSVNYDFTLRMGDSWVEVTQDGISAGALLSHAIGLSTIEASTAFTGGIRATNNDAAGNRYLLAAPRTITSDVANSRMYVTADTYSTMTFQVAPDYRTNSIGTLQTDTSNRDLFLDIRNESRRVVGR